MEQLNSSCPEKPAVSCLDRRKFLLLSGAGAVSVTLGQMFPGKVFPQDENREVTLTPYPRKKIAQLSQLVPDKPIEFLYPDEGPHSISFLVKLGQRAETVYVRSV